jgi:hypothetical protein
MLPERDSHSDVADAFLHLFHAAQIAAGFLESAFRGHAAAHVFGGGEFEVGAELVVELLFSLLLAEEVSKKSGEHAIFLCGSRGAGHRQRDALPALRFGLEAAAARARQTIEFRATPGLRFAPFGGEPSGLFHAVQGGKERAGFYVECAIGDLGDAAGDALPCIGWSALDFRISRSRVPCRSSDSAMVL